MLGITSINGFPLPMEERFARIKAAGFDSILLWWGLNEAESRSDRVALANKFGLHIENVHATTDNLNALWLEGESGEDTLQELTQEITDCHRLGVDTIVVHLTNGSTPPPVSPIGISRIERLILHAEKNKVKLAFENVRKPEHVRYVLDHYDSSFAGLCYDSGHENFWSSDIDWLKEYGGRVLALHLHDNMGDRDSHLVPFDGQIDWNRKAKQIAASSYRGAITIESEMHASDRYEKDGFQAFLSYAYQNGKELAKLIHLQKKI